MQFTERNPLVIGAIVTAAIIAFTIAGLSITRADLVGGYEVVAEFADANGLRVGDQVLVAGVRSGRVLSLDLAGDRVEARLQVEDVDLPAQTTARVVLRTLVGTRAVALDPQGSFDDLLADGDRIPLDRTRTTIDLPEFGDTAEELLTEIDSEAFNTFLRSLTDLTEGQRQEVSELVEGGTRLTAIVNDQEAQVRELLRQLRGVGSTLNERDAQLIAIIDDFDVALGRLAERREDLRRLFRETNNASVTATELIVDTREQLDGILTELHEDVAILNANQEALAEALAYSGDSIAGFASIALAVGNVEVPWGDVFVTSVGPAGVDILVGCGGLVDQQLDQLLGPDPRSCEEQENRTFPDDVEPGEPQQGPQAPQLPRVPDAPLGGSAQQGPDLRPERAEVDSIARRLLPGAGSGSGEGRR
jgi:phospholipid/cholesterol/gamma-HCH transport system substrate-binding protein